MPEISRFYGIIIKMYFGVTIRRTFTWNMEMTGH